MLLLQGKQQRSSSCSSNRARDCLSMHWEHGCRQQLQRQPQQQLLQRLQHRHLPSVSR